MHGEGEGQDPGGDRLGGIGRWQRPVKRVLGPVVRRLWPIDVTGLEHVPTSGPAVLCPNHLAAIDSFVLPAVLPRPVVFVGKSEYLEDWKTRALLPALGMIPLDRRGGEHAADALAVARSVLEAGGLFAIYPEGTRSRDGRLHRGHTGAARLALQAGAPLLPVGLVGTDGVQPVGSTWPRPFRPVSITFAEPIDVGHYRDRTGDHLLHRELIDEVMFEIRALTGQEYVSRYAPTGAPSAGSADGASGVAVRPSSADVLRSRPLETAAG